MGPRTSTFSTTAITLQLLATGTGTAGGPEGTKGRPKACLPRALTTFVCAASESVEVPAARHALLARQHILCTMWCQAEREREREREILPSGPARGTALSPPPQYRLLPIHSRSQLCGTATHHLMRQELAAPDLSQRLLSSHSANYSPMPPSGSPTALGWRNSASRRIRPGRWAGNRASACCCVQGFRHRVTHPSPAVSCGEFREKACLRVHRRALRQLLLVQLYRL